MHDIDPSILLDVVMFNITYILVAGHLGQFSSHLCDEIFYYSELQHGNGDVYLNEMKFLFPEFM